MSKEATEAAYVMSGQFTPENCALVLIDHQVGTLQFVHTMSPETSLKNAVTLAKAALDCCMEEIPRHHTSGQRAGRR